MEGKLIKNHYGFEYFLMDEKGETIATSESGKLSLKNCQAIERGYDLSELACNEIGIDISVIKHIDNKVIENDSVSTPIHEAGALGAGLYHRVKGFEIGFQKALEILGDKKFSEEDVKNVYLNSFKHEWFGDCIKSLQKTEWDVEIITEPFFSVGDNFHDKYQTRPKLDANGCLILKRK